MARNDWCISTSLGAIVVAASYAIWWSGFRTQDQMTPGVLAIGGCYFLSMFAYITRAFCRLPPGCSLATKPIRGGMWIAFRGGLVYGVCIAIGVSLACWYAARPEWNFVTIQYLLIAQIATIVFCGATMAPVGLLGGMVYRLHNWTRSEPGHRAEDAHDVPANEKHRNSSR